VPERAIAHRRKRADRRLLDAPSEGGHHQYFKVAIRRPVHVCPDIPRVLGDTLEIVLILGLNQQPARSGPSGCSLRGCSSSRVPPPGVNSSPPPRCFSALVSSRRLAPVPPLVATSNLQFKPRLSLAGFFLLVQARVRPRGPPPPPEHPRGTPRALNEVR
jgi:hypothetical protein